MPNPDRRAAQFGPPMLICGRQGGCPMDIFEAINTQRAMRRLKPDPATAKPSASADYLANHLAEVPVLIMVTLDPARVAPVTPLGANVFPAVQNLLLAARALGLRATL